MPRTSRSKTPAAPVPNAMVASAARVIAGRRKNIPSGTGSAWQNEAWEMLDVVGELEFYREWMSNAGSMCILELVELRADGEEVPVTVGPAADAMAALFGGQEGQSQMMASMFGHLAIPGETWLCGLLEPPDDPDGPDIWRVLAKDEVREQGKSWQIDRGDGEPEVYKAEDVFMTRIWRPHPRKWVEATSSVRSALPILRQLVGLSKRDAANIDSRLLGNGILAIPTETTFATPGGPVEGKPEDDGSDALQDPFLAALIEAGVTAIEQPGSPESLFPVLMRAPGQYLDKIKHIVLATPLDEKAMEQQERLIKRLANSLDVPAEVLLGLADVNHWTGWLLDENAIKMHVQPLGDTVAHGIQTRYLWPALQGGAATFDPALRRFRVKCSTARLRQRPNRAPEATQARQDLVITDAAWAREVGFQDSDLLDPTSDEYRRKMLQKTAQGVTTADVTVAALAELGVNLTPKASEVEADPAAVAPAAAPPAIEGPPAPDPVVAPQNDRGIPEQQAAAALAVAETLTDVAVTRAWNRAGKRGKVRLPVAADALDAAMAGVWDNVPRASALLGLDPDRLTAALDGYTRALLSTGAEYDRRVLATILVRDVLTVAPIALGRSA
jgi:hypothetical protein